MYQFPQNVFYYPEGERIESVTAEEGVAAYIRAHFSSAGPVRQMDAIDSTGFAHAVSFTATDGVEHGIYLDRRGDKWVVAAVSRLVPPESLTPNCQIDVMAGEEGTISAEKWGDHAVAWLAVDVVHMCTYHASDADCSIGMPTSNWWAQRR